LFDVFIDILSGETYEMGDSDNPVRVDAEELFGFGVLLIGMDQIKTFEIIGRV